MYFKIILFSKLAHTHFSKDSSEIDSECTPKSVTSHYAHVAHNGAHKNGHRGHSHQVAHNSPAWIMG